MNSFESISVGDRTLQLYTSAPDTDSRPGILLLHPWWGFNECMRDVCDRLAEAGFLVVAPDLYHGDLAATIEEAEAIESSLDAARVVEDIAAAFDYASDHPRLAAGPGMMGFSMGVYYGLEALRDRPNDVDAAVLFYGTSDGEYERTSMAVLGHYAENDRFESERDVVAFRERLQTGGASVTFHTYPETDHWFFESDRPEYDEEAAELAWSRTIDFLRNAL